MTIWMMESTATKKHIKIIENFDILYHGVMYLYDFEDDQFVLVGHENS